jgi:hypothetical protein
MPVLAAPGLRFHVYVDTTTLCVLGDSAFEVQADFSGAGVRKRRRVSRAVPCCLGLLVVTLESVVDGLACSMKLLDYTHARLESLRIGEHELDEQHDFRSSCFFRCARISGHWNLNREINNAP